MKISEALRQLGAADRELPEIALGWALGNMNDASHALMQVLARCAQRLEAASDADVNTALFALHLFAEKRETRAWPLVAKLARSPDGLPAILGETMHWTGSALLISLFDGNAAPLFEMAGPKTSDGLLAACALEAIAYLTATGGLSRGVTHEFLRDLADDDGFLDADGLWDSWAVTVAMLGFADLLPKARAALSRGGLSPEEFDISDIEDLLKLSLEDPMAGFSREGVGPIDDAIAALRKIQRESIAVDTAGSAENVPLAGDIAAAPAVTNPTRNVGRNDPCPCGSGRKFKNCCKANPQ